MWGLHGVFQASLLVYAAVGIAWLALQTQRGVGPACWGAAALLSLTLVSPWLGDWPARGEAAGFDKPRVYGVSYGDSLKRERRVIPGGSSSKRVSFAWLFWVVQANGRTVLVDTGCDDPERIKEEGIRDFVPPIQRLGQLHIAPEEVSDIILTHAHWDHMGGLASYPNATLWMQEEEYHYVRDNLNMTAAEAHGVRWRDWQLVLTAERAGRLKLVRGDHTLLPGITMTRGGAHTPGSQYVTVETLDGPVVIAGDTTYLYESGWRRRLFGDVSDRAANLTALEAMQRRAASPFLLLPGHDPLVMRWFPRISEGVVQIAAFPDSQSPR